MKLLFRPDKFKDKNGVEIKLEDIEIEDIQPERCDCGCDGAFLNITIVRHKHEPATFKDVGIEELQKLVENAWNSSSIPDLVFKRKEIKTKQRVNLGKTIQYSNLPPVLDIINEEDLEAPTRPQIFLDSNDGHKKMKMPDGSTFCITCSKLH